jgi:hypothetical protein
VAQALAAKMPELRLLRNDLGRGVLNAMKAGIVAARAPFVLVSTADASDDPEWSTACRLSPVAARTW